MPPHVKWVKVSLSTEQLGLPGQSRSKAEDQNGETEEGKERVKIDLEGNQSP